MKVRNRTANIQKIRTLGEEEKWRGQNIWKNSKNSNFLKLKTRRFWLEKVYKTPCRRDREKSAPAVGCNIRASKTHSKCFWK